MTSAIATPAATFRILIGATLLLVAYTIAARGGHARAEKIFSRCAPAAAPLLSAGTHTRKTDGGDDARGDFGVADTD
jgi:hypothetical protein